MKLILASASPRRAELLTEAGYVFDVAPAEVDEQKVSAASPSELAQRLAALKAEAIAEKFPDDVVLGADTIVCLGEQVLGKPPDAQAAQKMLQFEIGRMPVVARGDDRTVLGFLPRAGILAARLRRFRDEHVLEQGWLPRFPFARVGSVTDGESKP